MQQILGVHVAAPYEPRVPPVYTAGVPTFTTPAVINIPYEVDQYEEMEKDARLKEDASINAKLQAVIYQPGGPSHRYPNNPQIAAHTSYVPVYNTQPHYNPPRAPAYQNPPRPYVPVQAPIHQNRPAYAPRPRPNPEARNARAYTLIAEPYVQLFERLRTAGVLQPVEGKLPDPIPHNFDGNKRCAYHSGVQGHDTEDCYGLKNQIESLIRRGVIKCTPAPPNVNNNPLPNHENREVNMVIQT
uniref:Gag-pro n=1 Tax=Solanum tuberosum TaxID=4113 RepID=M1DGZ3_SOLTU